MSLTKFEMLLILVIVALVVMMAAFVGCSHEAKTAGTQENKTIIQSNPISIPLTPIPAPTYFVHNRTLGPMPTENPKSIPVVAPAGADKNILEISFDDLSGKLSLDAIAYRVSKKNWSNSVVLQQITDLKEDNNKRVELLDGVFEEVVYSQRGNNYYLSNVSTSSGTNTIFDDKKIGWYVSFFETNEGRIVYGYKDGILVMAGFGLNAKTQPYGMSGEVGGRGEVNSVGDSPSGSTGQGSQSQDIAIQ